MIGILCSDNMERNYAEELHSLYTKAGRKKDESIIVFTVSNIDFLQKTLKGSLVTGENIEIVRVPIPPVIYNFSLQKDVNGVKARKQLEEMHEIKLINDANRYDQGMIMDMLKSSKLGEKHLLPYYVYNKSVRNFKPDDNQAYITMPARGASLSRIIYAEPEEGTDWVKGSHYFKKGHICDYIDASLCQTKWIFVEVPELIIRQNQPVVVRVYMQKASRELWRVIGRNIYPEFRLEGPVLADRIDKAAIAIINYLNRFLPSLGMTFIDFVLSTNRNPYFLHLSGFEGSFFEQELDENVYKRFYNNLLRLAGDYKGMHKED